MSALDSHGEAYEAKHVHEVYEQIASHFSLTRYKPWPIVEQFLNELPNGAVGLDVGCGNGKYLAVNPNIYIVGSDRSFNLAKIASKHQPHSAIVADVLDLPHGRRSFDFAISIAVVHHLSTPERRIHAIQSLLEILKPEAKALVYVWALEQGSSRRGWTEHDNQDVMVPWVMKGAKKLPSQSSGEDCTAAEAGQADKTFHRYYHLYRKGELEKDVHSAGGRVIAAGYEKDNWWAVAEPAL